MRRGAHGGGASGARPRSIRKGGTGTTTGTHLGPLLEALGNARAAPSVALDAVKTLTHSTSSIAVKEDDVFRMTHAAISALSVLVRQLTLVGPGSQILHHGHGRSRGASHRGLHGRHAASDADVLGGGRERDGAAPTVRVVTVDGDDLKMAFQPIQVSLLEATLLLLTNVLQESSVSNRPPMESMSAAWIHWGLFGSLVFFATGFPTHHSIYLQSLTLRLMCRIAPWLPVGKCRLYGMRHNFVSMLFTILETSEDQQHTDTHQQALVILTSLAFDRSVAFDLVQRGFADHLAILHDGSPKSNLIRLAFSPRLLEHTKAIVELSNDPDGPIGHDDDDGDNLGASLDLSISERNPFDGSHSQNALERSLAIIPPSTLRRGSDAIEDEVASLDASGRFLDRLSLSMGTDAGSSLDHSGASATSDASGSGSQTLAAPVMRGRGKRRPSQVHKRLYLDAKLHEDFDRTRDEKGYFVKREEAPKLPPAMDRRRPSTQMAQEVTERLLRDVASRRPSLADVLAADEATAPTSAAAPSAASGLAPTAATASPRHRRRHKLHDRPMIPEIGLAPNIDGGTAAASPRREPAPAFRPLLITSGRLPRRATRSHRRTPKSSPGGGSGSKLTPSPPRASKESLTAGGGGGGSGVFGKNAKDSLAGAPPESPNKLSRRLGIQRGGPDDDDIDDAANGGDSVDPADDDDGGIHRSALSGLDLFGSGQSIADGNGNRSASPTEADDDDGSDDGNDSSTRRRRRRRKRVPALARLGSVSARQPRTGSPRSSGGGSKTPRVRGSLTIPRLGRASTSYPVMGSGGTPRGGRRPKRDDSEPALTTRASKVVDRLTKATSFTGTHKFGAAVRASLDEDSHREWARSMHIQRRQREELRKLEDPPVNHESLLDMKMRRIASNTMATAAALRSSPQGSSPRSRRLRHSVYRRR